MAKHKLIYLFIIILFVSSCATRREFSGRVDKAKVPEEIVNQGLEGIYRNNIGNKDLIIRRVGAVINKSQKSTRVTGYMKLKKDRGMVCSIRSIAGMEIIRIYIDGDSIKINDRLNKDVYIGGNEYIRAKYGADIESIGLLWGDLFYSKDMIIRKGNGGVSKIFYSSDGITRYLVTTDRERNKVKEYVIYRGDVRLAKINYKNYVEENSFVYPSEIYIDVPEENMMVEIELKGVNWVKVKDIAFRISSDSKIKYLK